MGTNLGGLVNAKPIKIDELKGKTISIDAFNILYQFITSIRQQDGTYLMDSKGRVTSHLTGLFSRTTNLLQKGIKPIFVFDGKAPELKKAEQQRRRHAKEDAQVKYEEAQEQEDVEGMRKYAGRTARLTTNMIEESKKLLEGLGVAVVQAPSEGEAQVAHIVRNGHAYAGASQDYDSLLHKNPRIIRNLTLAGRRKRAGTLGYTVITPEFINLSQVLNDLGIDHRRLIALSMFVGTDYNIGGVKGIGPKKALAHVKKGDMSDIFKDWPKELPPWKDILDTIENMPVTDDYELLWQAPDEEAVTKLLCDEHDFSIERVNASLKRLMSSAGARAQKGLGEFFQ